MIVFKHEPLLVKSCMHIRLISASRVRSSIQPAGGRAAMLVAFLFCAICLFGAMPGAQLQLDGYSMQMIYHQPSAFSQQHLLGAFSQSSNSGARYLVQPNMFDYSYAPMVAKPQAALVRMHRNVNQRLPMHHLQQQHNQRQQANYQQQYQANRQARPTSASQLESKLLGLKLEGADSPASLQSMMRNLNQQILLAENYNGGHPGGLAASAPLTGQQQGQLASTLAVNAIEDPSLVAANLIESLDELDSPPGQFVGSLGAEHGHLGGYQGRDLDHAHHPAHQLSVSAINNNSLALYRLLNLIDQSVPPAQTANMLGSPVSSGDFAAISNHNQHSSQLPFPHSKTSLPSSASPLVNARMAPRTASNHNHDGNSNNSYNQDGGGSRSSASHQRQQSIASQSSAGANQPVSNSNWPKKRSQAQQHWRSQQHPDAIRLVDSDSNSVELRPAALKMMKSSPYLNGLNTSAPRRNSNSNHIYHNNNNNNDNNADDIGFGSKQVSGNSEKLNGALTSSTLSNSKVPHDADSEMIAANNAPRCDKFTPDICVDDFEYPEQAIIDEIQKKRDVFELMYSEVKDNEPLVDGIPRDVEESYNYDYYYYGPKSNPTSGRQLQQQANSVAAAVSSAVSSDSQWRQDGHHGPQRNQRREHSHRNHQTMDVASVSPPSASSGAREQADGSAESIAQRSRLVGSIRDTIERQQGQPTELDYQQSANQSALSGQANTPMASSIDGMDALIGAITPNASPSSSSASAQSPPTTGFICPSEVMYGKPKLAKNKKGLWKVIVNAGEFTQTVRLEKCLLPNKKCNYVSAHSYESRCAQVHSHHRLLVFEKGRGFYIDTFRLPTGCNCHVTRKNLSRAVSASSSLGGRPSSGLNTPPDSQAADPDAPLQQQVQSQHQQHQQQNQQQQQLNQHQPGEYSGNSRESSAFERNADRDPDQDHHQPYQPPKQTIPPGYRLPGDAGSGYSRPKSVSSSSESSLSQTLWSILSGGGANGNSNGSSPFQRDLMAGPSPAGAYSAASASNAYSGYHDRPSQQAQRDGHHSQSAILEHLSMNPTLAANISDSVLRQLIDVGTISSVGTGLAPSASAKSIGQTATGAPQASHLGGGSSQGQQAPFAVPIYYSSPDRQSPVHHAAALVGGQWEQLHST